jgi:hypothetical protein
MEPPPPTPSIQTSKLSVSPSLSKMAPSEAVRNVPTGRMETTVTHFEIRGGERYERRERVRAAIIPGTETRQVILRSFSGTVRLNRTANHGFPVGVHFARSPEFEARRHGFSVGVRPIPDDE